ncbi:MAG: MFS transporter [Proteobacteria bacterium]|nr:MAG: MFS transporter [Pseudomonadota bacterium]
MMRSRRVASLATLLFSAAQVSMIVLYPWISEKSGLSLSQTILFFSVGSLLFLFGSPFWGYIADQRGPKFALQFGVLGQMVALIGVGLVTYSADWMNSFGAGILLLVTRVIYGLTCSAIVPVSQAIHSNDLPGNRHRALSRHSMNLALGRVLGLTLVVLLKDHYASYLAALVSCAALVLILVTHQHSEVKFENQFVPPKLTIKSLLRLNPPRSIRWFLTIVFVFSLVLESLNSLFSKTLQLRFDFTASQASGRAALYLLMSALVILLTQSIFRQLSKRENSHLVSVRGLKWGGGAFFAGVVLLGSADTGLRVVVALGLVSMGIGLVAPSYLTLISEREPSARVAGLVSAIQTLGYFAGGMMMALSIQGSVNLSWQLLSVISVFWLFLIWIRLPKIDSEASC